MRQQQKLKNQDHLNKYKLIEKELKEEIEQLKQDLDFSNSIRTKQELKLDELENEVRFLRHSLSQKITDLEKLKSKVVQSDHSFMIPTDNSGNYDPHHEQTDHHRKLEQNLRMTISQRDKTLCVLTIQN